MLNDLPKKEKKKKDLSNPTKWQLFWRTQVECLRRAVTPYLMYLFMSLLCLACQSFGNRILGIVLGIVCILGGAFFNGHLLYNTGATHYGAYVAGEVHRRNALFGIKSGGDHRPEREYRPWKGFLIGFYTGIPVLVFGILGGIFENQLATVAWIYYAFAMFAGYAIIPITWFGTRPEGGLIASPFYSLLFILLSVAVSGVFYIVGADRERRRRLEETQRMERAEEAGKKARGKKK